jgi:proteasome accessory factor A
VYGLETEFGVAVSAGPSTPEEAARGLFLPVVAWGRSSNVFTPAGARLYLDVGSHPEYATAECDTLGDLLAQDAAGELVMAALAAAWEQTGAGRLHLLKNNVDSAGNSYGCHENYQVARAGASRLAPRLIPFLVSRQLIAGAGRILTSPRGARFVLSQRADHIVEATSSATTRSRPMINTRDEPHADGQKFRRLHVIVGDSSVAGATTMLKVGATDLVLRALEQGVALPDLELDNPVAAIKEIAHGWETQHPVPLAAGGTITGLQLQVAYFEAAAPLAANDWDRRVVDLWARTLAAWERMDFDPVATEIDWVIKHRLLQRYQAKHPGVSLLDPRVQRLDLAYHDIGPAGLGGKLRAAGAMARVVEPAAAARAVLQPPATTRANARGALIKAARAAGLEYSVDWVRFKLADGPAVSVWDPLDAANPAAFDLAGELWARAAAGGAAAQAKAPAKPGLDAILAAAAGETGRDSGETPTEGGQ